LAGFTQNPNVYYATTPSNLSSHLTEFRVVSWGIRLLAKDTAFAAKGKYTIAIVPTSRNAPSFNTLNTVTASTIGVATEYLSGVNILVNDAIINLPTARTFSAQDLLRNEVQVCGLPYHNSFYEFKGVQDRVSLPWAAGQVLADEGVFNNTTGLVNATAGGRKDPSSLAGGSCILIAVSGAPASAQEFDIEYIYHLEGTPPTGPANTTAIVPSSMRVTNGSTALVESVVSAAHATGSVIRAVSSALAPGATTAITFAGELANAAMRRPYRPRLM